MNGAWPPALATISTERVDALRLCSLEIMARCAGQPDRLAAELVAAWASDVEAAASLLNESLMLNVPARSRRAENDSEYREVVAMNFGAIGSLIVMSMLQMAREQRVQFIVGCDAFDEDTKGTPSVFGGEGTEA